MKTATIALTRRTALAGAIAAAPVSVWALPPGPPPVSLERRLRAALARLGPVLAPGTRLDLVDFAETTAAGATQIAAIVRMTWPPGMRQRRFRAAGRDPDRAFTELLAEILKGLPGAAGALRT